MKHTYLTPSKIGTSMLSFKKMDRSCRIEPGWRLATVEEAKNNMKSIQRNNLLEEWDRARLLDGWIGGRGYEFHVQVGFKSCLGYMLVVESTTEILNTVDRDAALYSKVYLSEEGRSAALFLCCEDWNYEVLHWLIEGQKEEGCTSGVAIIVGDETEAASELVSAVARELHGVRAKSRVPKPDFSCDSMRAMTIDILKSVGDKITNYILTEALYVTALGEISVQCWQEMGLTEDLGRFQEFGFDTNVTSTWEAVADTVWYAMADTMAVAIVAECCQVHNRLVMHPDPLAERKMMEDRAFVVSLVPYAQELLNKTFYGTDSLWKFVKAAAKEAKGDGKRFNEVFRDRGYGTFSYNGKYNVLNAFLVQAAKKGDVNLVERLIESGVKPSETDDDRGKTALHHAAKVDDESKGLEIAGLLLRKESLANAVDRKMRTPLHRAAFCGHANMCGFLLQHNASVTSRDEKGRTPLHHALLSEQQNEKVVRVLITAEVNDSVQGTDPLLDAKDKNGKTPLDFAVECQDTNVKMVVRLLSQSSQPRNYFKKLHLSLYLRESSRMGYRNLVLDLLNEGADPLDPDVEGKTAAHYAAEGEDEEVACEILFGLLLDGKQENTEVERATARDKYGRNVLHVAALRGHIWLCRRLLCRFPNIDSKDRDGQSAIYYAVSGADNKDDKVLDIFIFSEQGTNEVFLKDDSQTTPLHVAAQTGNLKMVEKLLSKRVISGQKRKSYIGASDVLGQTALHKAASGGHEKIVKKLLEEGAHPLEERDSDGKTALHYAVQAENGEDAMAITKLLLKRCEANDQKGLLLVASAVGIGSAEQSLSSNSLLKQYLADERGKILPTEKKNLVKVAARLGNIDMTSELLTRGANINLIRNEEWIATLSQEEKRNVEEVLEQIDNIVEQGTDKPALWDNLGRSAFADGLAALFLNPFVKSPITVGISGEWGMGKSSLMVQTERILIQTAAQLAFSNSFTKVDFREASDSKLSANGQARRRKIANALERLLTKKSRERESEPVEEPLDANEVEPKLTIIQKIGRFIKRVLGYGKFTAKETDPLDLFLGNYQPKNREIFKCLAVMDRHDMFESDKKEDKSGFTNRRFGGMPWEEDTMQGTTPSILTVWYNAWKYRNESEAWAGLAVEITKELEATMTVEHKLRTSWRYNWKNRRNSICFGVILPCFLAVLVAIWFTTIVWLLLDKAQNEHLKGFKYGGLPATVIVAAWGVGKSVLSFVKPISSQVVDYICLPDHSQKLGYHQNVISDINFLKKELCYRPSCLWKVFAFIWCCITFSWDENYVPETRIPKMPPAFTDNLRMVVFVDDLDRCQENVILKILSAVNLVLAACEINVILGMDKSMIERAIIRKFGDKSSKPNKSNQDLADKYLSKIIQLPLDLPDPTDLESQNFLQGQLGMWRGRKGSSNPATQTKIHNNYGRRKVNPKFQIGTSIPKKTKLARGETMKYLAESGAEQERARRFSDTAQQGIVKTERQETIEKPAKGTGVEETLIEITERTDNEQSIKRVEQGGKEQMAGTQKQQEDRESEQRLKDLSPITIEMIIPKYSRGEREAFCFLHTRSTRRRKLPREWKGLMTYHRLAWNILSRSPEVIALIGWQVQLIAWVFVCWQWKHLITTLVQDWNNLEVLRKWIRVNDIHKGEVIEESRGPSLREIVEHYIEWKWSADKELGDIFQGDNATKKKEDTSDSVNEEVGVNCSSSGEVEKTSGNLPEKNMRTISSEEDTKGQDNLKEVERKVLKEDKEQEGGRDQGVGVNWSRSNEDVENTSGNLPEKNMRTISSEEDTRREDYLKKMERRILKEDREQKAGNEQDDLEGELKLLIKKVLQEKEVKDMLKGIIKEAFKEEKAREKQLRDFSNSYDEDNKGESSLQQGTTAKQNQKASHKVINNGKNKANDDEEREEWWKLRETLSRYNVSMDGIQAFQKFRFYCEPGHLPWPLPEQD